MRYATILSLAAVFLFAGSAYAQELEFTFSPEGTELSDAFAPGVQNGARGLSGPFDLDNDGNIEILVAQHSGAGGLIHVIENQGVDNWVHVYSTALIDSTNNTNNARYATGGDLDGDGRGEIIYVAGAGYNTDLDPTLEVGVYVWEYDGQGDDNYGEYPASVGNFQSLQSIEPSGVHAQKIWVQDIDGDDQQEVIFAANGVSAVDFFYVLSHSGDLETDGAGGFDTWNIELAHNPRDNADVWGSGSPMDAIPADLNGDGNMDISFHSWNYFNFFNGTATGADTYVLPDESTTNPHIWATEPDDHAGLLGGIAVDIDDDGTDEVFYPNFNTSNLAVLDYDQDQDVLSITANELVIDVVEGSGWGGIDSGDMDGDGFPELLIGGSGYSPASYNAGEPSRFLNIVEFMGGDPTDPASWSVDNVDTGDPSDTTGFNIVHRDSLGEMMTYYESAFSKQGVIDTSGTANDNIFPTGVAYLGDADGDGMNEVAMSFQGIDDSLVVFDEVWNVDSLDYVRSVREIVAAPVRSFVRIYQFPAGYTVAVDDDAGLPEGFKLHANYPNPFNPSTTIGFTVPRDASLTVRVYDATGRIVNTLVNSQPYASGTYEITWNGTNLSGQSVASGTYFYSLEFDGRKIVRPMVLVK